MVPQAATFPAARGRGQLFGIALVGDDHLVDAVADASIEVIHACFSLSGSGVIATFKDSDGTALTGAFDAAGIYRLLGGRLRPKFSTPNGKGLDLAVVNGSLRGFLVYRLNRTS
jgi:hypothetical protein